MIPVMNAALVLGVAVILPRALREPRVPWLVASVSVLISLWLPAGALASIFVTPWLLLTIRAGLTSLWSARAQEHRAAALWRAMVAGFAGTAALALIFSRLEVTLFNIPEPIVKLTALHFTYAGAGTLALALRLAEVRPSRLATLTRWLVFLAPPVVASGFILRSALGQVGGATLMTAGVWLVAGLQLPDALHGSRRALWWVSCLSPLVAMGLGLSWAAAQYFPSIPALTVPDMVPTHGALNAFGFVLCGHLAASNSLTSTRKS